MKFLVREVEFETKAIVDGTAIAPLVSVVDILLLPLAVAEQVVGTSVRVTVKGLVGCELRPKRNLGSLLREVDAKLYCGILVKVLSRTTPLQQIVLMV
jgi:hypothetical protein